MQENIFNLWNVIKVLIPYKKIIILITFLAAIAGYIVCLLLPVYYKSSATFYSYNLRSFDAKNILAEEPPSIYGSEEDTDRLISIGKSRRIEDSIIQKFNLYEKYEIKKDEKYHRTKVGDMFKKNLKVEKNENGALMVAVMDKDPKVAADMVAEILRLMDLINKEPVMELNNRIFKVYKKSLDEKYRFLDSLSKLSKMPDPYLSMELTESGKLKENYDRVDGMLNSGFRSIFIVEPPGMPEKRSFPVYWIIVAGSTAGALLLTILAILLLHLYREEIRNN